MSDARTSDLWWKNAIVYCLDVETFFDSDGDGHGDFEPEPLGPEREDRLERVDDQHGGELLHGRIAGFSVDGAWAGAPAHCISAVSRVHACTRQIPGCRVIGPARRTARPTYNLWSVDEVTRAL